MNDQRTLGDVWKRAFFPARSVIVMFFEYVNQTERERTITRTGGVVTNDFAFINALGAIVPEDSVEALDQDWRVVHVDTNRCMQLIEIGSPSLPIRLTDSDLQNGCEDWPIGPARGVPTLGFSRTVLVAYSGPVDRNAVLGLQIVRIDHSGGNAVVQVKLTVPAEECVARLGKVSPQSTYPFHFVDVPRMKSFTFNFFKAATNQC